MQPYPKNHICDKAIKEIVEIQKPLNKLDGLHLLFYGETIGKDKGYLFYTNKPYWIIRTALNVPLQGTYKYEGIFPWSEFHPDSFITIAQDFNIYNPVNIIRATETGKEVFTFAFSHKKNPGFTFYLNNLDLLKKFMDHFKSAAKEQIKEAQDTAIKIPPHFVGQEIEENSYQEAISYLLSNFSMPTDLADDSALKKLTEREFICLCYYLTGKTAAEIAKILKFAPKTASAHLYNVRAKLGCKNRSELFQKAFEHGLIQTVGLDSLK